MTAPGTPVPYFVLENADGFYYVAYQKPWVGYLHYASMLSETLAEKLARRYPGSTIEREVAYDVNPKEHLKDVGEPSANRALEDAVTLAKRDGQSLETISVTVEKAYHAAKAA